MKKLVFDLELRSASPVWSVLVPVFNQADGLEEVLQGIYYSLSSPFEILLIDDSSTDGTLSELKKIPNFLQSEHVPNLHRIRVWTSKKPLFETACDNFLAAKADGEYLLEVQGDIILRDKGIDLRLQNKFESHPTLCAISGRGGHSFSEAELEWRGCLGSSVARASSLPVFIIRRIANRLLGRLAPGAALHRTLGSATSPVLSENIARVGRLGVDFFQLPMFGESQKDSLQFTETVIRGPLALRASAFLELDGFREDRFFLGFDDHDFCHRAAAMGKRVAYLPCEVFSPVGAGSTRRKRPLKHELYLWLNLIKRRKHAGKALGH